MLRLNTQVGDTSDIEPSSVRYSSQEVFVDPVSIRGEDRFVVPFEETVFLKEEEKRESITRELVEVCRPIEDRTRVLFLENIQEASLERVEDDGIYLSVDYTQLHFPLVSSAMSNFAAFLGIPYKYAQKSPGELNHVNFSHWKRQMDHQASKKPLMIAYLENDSEEPKTVLVFKKMNKQDYDQYLRLQRVDTVLPRFSDIIEDVEGILTRQLGTQLTGIRGYGFGFQDRNKGNHFARFVVEDPRFGFHINGDQYSLGVSVQTNYNATSKDFGRVSILFDLMRLVCINGLWVTLTRDQIERAIDQLLASIPEGEGYEIPEEYLPENREATVQFLMNRGISVPLTSVAREGGQVNSVLEKTVGLKATGFAALNSVLGNTLGQMTTPYPETNPERFLEMAHTLANRMGFDRRTMRLFYSEFANSLDEETGAFRTPLDIVSFLTHIAKTHDSAKLLEVEKDSAQFAWGLMQLARNDPGYPYESILSQTIHRR